MKAGATPRFLGGYGPAAVIGVALMLTATLVPSTSQKVRVESAAQSRTSGGSSTDSSAETGGDIGESTTTVAGSAALGATSSQGGGATATGPTGKAAGSTGKNSSTAGPTAGAVAGQTRSCGPFQVKGDVYSPPCFKWGGGNNGGATARGVTADTVTLSVRNGTFDKGVIDAISQAALKQGGSNFLAGETPELIKATINGLVDYFNARYEFYGRKLKVDYFAPKGDLINEVLGGGQEGADADAIKAADDVKAFVDVSAVSPPYADALARHGVIGIGAPYMSKSWMQSRKGYEWSWFTDCNTVAQMMSSWYVARMGGRPVAFAGAPLNGKARKLAIIAPDSSWFSECVKSAVSSIRSSGLSGEASLDPFTYKLDLNAMAPQAYSIVPQLVSGGATSVMCFCDPLMLLFLTSKAREQGFQPEWLETGVAFSDQDAVGQLFDQQSWDGAVGISFAGGSLAITGGTGYSAFKSVHPDQTPSKTVEALFYQLQMVAIGVQLAGPNLTPATFEQGMFSYPARSGPAGTWTFGPGDYTAAGDAREIYYSSRTPSSKAGGNGSWLDPNAGKRFGIGQFPRSNPTNGK